MSGERERWIEAARESGVCIRAAPVAGLDDATARAIAAISAAHRLTRVEREIVALAVEGVPRKWLADRLGVSENTVKTHVKNLLGKIERVEELGDVVDVVRRAAGGEGSGAGGDSVSGSTSPHPKTQLRRVAVGQYPNSELSIERSARVGTVRPRLHTGGRS